MEVGVKSKRMMAEVGALPDNEEAAEEAGFDESAGWANCHWRAAWSARSAKNWLEAGLASSAVETVPSGLSCTRTLMRTVPRMVARDFSETTGMTLRRTVGASGLAFAAEDVAPVAEADAAGALGFAADGADAELFAAAEAFTCGAGLLKEAPALGVDKSVGAELTYGGVAVKLGFCADEELVEEESELDDGVLPPLAEFSGAEDRLLEPAELDAAELGVAELRER